MRTLAILDAWLGRILRAACVLGLVGLLVLLAVNVLGRVTSRWSVVWFDEVVIFLFAWTVFLAAAELWRTREHFAIDLVPIAFAGSLFGRVLDVGIALAGLVFALALARYGWDFTARTTQITPILQLPQRWTYVCMPLSGAIMSVYALRDLVQAARGRGRADPSGSLVASAVPEERDTQKLEINDHAV